jgi:hypothetical protein
LKIRGLKHKINEFLCHLPQGLPVVLCVNEHHLKSIESSHIQTDNYLFVSNYCRKSTPRGGVSIFIYKHLSITTINLDTYRIEHNIEAYAIKFNFSYRHICILSIEPQLEN